MYISAIGIKTGAARGQGVGTLRGDLGFCFDIRFYRMLNINLDACGVFLSDKRPLLSREIYPTSDIRTGSYSISFGIFSPPIKIFKRYKKLFFLGGYSIGKEWFSGNRYFDNPRTIYIGGNSPPEPPVKLLAGIFYEPKILLLFFVNDDINSLIIDFSYRFYTERSDFYRGLIIRGVAEIPFDKLFKLF